MNLKDISIDLEPFQWGEILNDWIWILPTEFQVLVVTKFGDIFFRFPDDSVSFLDTGAGSLKKVSDSVDQFCQMADVAENVDIWFLPSLISTLRERGVHLSHTECYSFELLPGLGGKYEPQNVKPCDLAVHLALTGQIFFQIKDVPDGAKVHFTLKG